MPKSEEIQKVIRIFPLLDKKRKKKALAWLKRHGYQPNNTPPVEQDYRVASPPGSARLLRLPMYLENLGSNGQGLGYYNNSIITDAGAGVAAQNNAATILNIDSTTNPVLNQNNSTNSEDTTFGHFTVRAMTFSTRQVPWAKMRVVGIETTIINTPALPLRPRPTDATTNNALGVGFAVPPRLLLKNYRVAGSANLFLQDGFIDGTFFDVERFMLGGLRAYPILESPKLLKVDVAISGEHYHGSAAALDGNVTISDDTTVPSQTNATFTVNAIVDVLDDMDYGEPIEKPPYARGINMERREPPYGQSFIVGE
jgi:hypothetical protein